MKGFDPKPCLGRRQLKTLKPQNKKRAWRSCVLRRPRLLLAPLGRAPAPQRALHGLAVVKVKEELVLRGGGAQADRRAQGGVPAWIPHGACMGCAWEYLLCWITVLGRVF